MVHKPPLLRWNPCRSPGFLPWNKWRQPSDWPVVPSASAGCRSGAKMETAQRLAGCSFGVGGVPFWGKLRASMEQMETAHRLAGCSFGVSGVPFWGKLRASMKLLRFQTTLGRQSVKKNAPEALRSPAERSLRPSHQCPSLKCPARVPALAFACAAPRQDGRTSRRHAFLAAACLVPAQRPRTEPTPPDVAANLRGLSGIASIAVEESRRQPPG